MEENYEIDNGPVKATMRGIADKVRGALPEGWGFALFIYEYGTDGALFYISTAAREDVVKMLDEWKAKQQHRDEVNPEHPVTQGMRDQWHKVVAVMLHKLWPLKEVGITSKDLADLEQAYGGLPSVIADDSDGTLRVRIVDKEEGARVAQAEQERRRGAAPDAAGPR